MNDFVIDMMDKLATEAKHDLDITGKETTLREWHLNTATKLVLPGELKKHGVSEGTKAIRNFNANRKDIKKEISKCSSLVDDSIYFTTRRKVFKNPLACCWTG